MGRWEPEGDGIPGAVVRLEAVGRLEVVETLEVMHRTLGRAEWGSPRAGVHAIEDIILFLFLSQLLFFLLLRLKFVVLVFQSVVWVAGLLIPLIFFWLMS